MVSFGVFALLFCLFRAGFLTCAYCGCTLVLCFALLFMSPARKRFMPVTSGVVVLPWVKLFFSAQKCSSLF